MREKLQVGRLPSTPFLALAQQLAPHLLAQGPQRIELSVVELRAAMHAGSLIFACHRARWCGA
jgi:hypothetical protein